MKFTADKQEILAALTTTNKATGKGVIPILESILFDIQNNNLYLTGTNMHVCINQRIDIKGNSFSKKIAVTASSVISLIKTLPDGPIEFTIEEIKGEKQVSYLLHIKSGKGLFKIPVESGDDFPEFKSLDSDVTISVKSHDFLEAIYKTVFACSEDEINQNMSNVLISFTDDKITLAATNGGILSVYNFQASSNYNKNLNVSPRALNLISLLSFNEDTEISISDNSISFKINDDTVFKSLLSHTNFPNYKSVIPADNPIKLTVNRAELLSALKRVQLFADVIHSVKFSVSSQELEISAEDDIKGKGKEIVSHDYVGEPLEIGFNVLFLIDILKRMDCEMVLITMKKINTPMLIKEYDAPDDSENLFLCMPLFLGK